MERLPYIDRHARTVHASPERVWSALLAAVTGAAGRRLPGPVVTVWGLRQPARTGDWSAPSTGDTLPGFVVARVEPPRLLTLRGRHRFSRYELRFTLEPAGADRVEVSAHTSAVFPGPLGRIYRTLVIDTRGHVLAVRRLLARTARRAEQPG